MEYGWAYLIPAIAIAGGITYAILNRYWKARAQFGSPAAQKAIEENTATNAAVLAKLESIETRLGVVEKTLTDIP
jgi:hypothetical protein